MPISISIIVVSSQLAVTVARQGAVRHRPKPQARRGQL
jgi:hypothetical protein